MVVLDTCIIIDHLRRGRSKSLLQRLMIAHSGESLALSVISVQELYQGKSTADADDESALLSTVGPLRILPYDFEIAQASGMLARELPRPIGLADAAIAATCLVNSAKLFTLDKKDFLKIPGLEFWRN